MGKLGDGRRFGNLSLLVILTRHDKINSEFLSFILTQMSIKESINNLADAMLLMEQLENPDYLEGN